MEDSAAPRTPSPEATAATPGSLATGVVADPAPPGEPPLPGTDGPRLDPPPGPASPARKGVLVGLALVGSLLMGLVGARFIADDDDSVGAVIGTPTVAPTSTATPSPTAAPTATPTSVVTPTPTRPAGEVPSTGAPTASLPTRAIDEPHDPPSVTATVTPVPSVAPSTTPTSTPAATATASPTEPTDGTPTAAPTGTTTAAAE